MKRVILNVIREQGYVFVNVCEPDLLGKVFKKGDISLAVNREFYAGEEVSLDFAFTLFEEANVVSLVGREIVDEAIKRGYVAKDGVLEIEGVKFAQVYNM
ncbi:DUF424 domain-containing protein [Stygiolobus caldivivus]|uniref:DUF424 family protein n=1 Tax=Stygiolobus caldivivus TaxID=2824673 RepID=A0A8D5ZHU2_9CREN|nr:DUF424 family protein [Stygiolobus caldivivus]BCU69016.1 hypothetical protein KN1_03130 [Stygiolobus caldivivus]